MGFFNKRALIKRFIQNIGFNIAKYSSSIVFNDIYAYKGDNKTPDDALNAIAAAYLMLSLAYRNKKCMI
ncbi:hypothetical protein [Borreliella japonica]|uniref:hypothetical protein n=1 Tax=Borreliella japonica TaxID=34095 RepID=UPI003AF1E163